MFTPEMNAFLAFVSIFGFAIQQALQVLDPLMSGITAWLVSNLFKTTEAVAVKKPLAMFVSAALGIWVCHIFGLNVFDYLPLDALPVVTKEKVAAAIKAHQGLGHFLTGCAVGGGTEGMNSLTKYLEYAKNAKKQDVPVKLSIIPTTASVNQKNTMSFVAIFEGDAQPIIWQVLQGNGGSIDNNGKYTAPPNTGTFTIVAYSGVDKTKVALASVVVT